MLQEKCPRSSNVQIRELLPYFLHLPQIGWKREPLGSMFSFLNDIQLLMRLSQKCGGIRSSRNLKHREKSLECGKLIFLCSRFSTHNDIPKEQQDLSCAALCHTLGMISATLNLMPVYPRSSLIFFSRASIFFR